MTFKDMNVIGTKRNRGSISKKRNCGSYEGSSAAAAAAASRTSSNLMSMSMNDLNEDILLEILCRLPCLKFLSRCKCVSKRWCASISGPEFMCSYLKRNGKQMVERTLINVEGEELVTRYRKRNRKLSPLFKRLKKIHRLKKDPYVLGAYNDLLLCCARTDSNFYQRDYYICNQFTRQWVALPPPPSIHKCTPVGFICDVPYYRYKEGVKDDQIIIQVNSRYRGRVVRLIQNKKYKSTCEFKVQIFSTETGVWTESIVSSPLILDDTPLWRPYVTSYPYNGVLYFSPVLYSESLSCKLLIGFDPFMITDKCRFIQFDQPDRDYVYDLKCIGVNKGWLQICHIGEQIITVWEINEEAISAGKLCLDQNRAAEYRCLEAPDKIKDRRVLAFDPNNDGTLYTEGSFYYDDYIFKFEIAKGGWEITAIRTPSFPSHDFYQLALPCWPTPVPKLVEKKPHET